MGRTGAVGRTLGSVPTLPDRPSPLARVPLWAAYFAVGVAALVVHWLLETGSLTQSWFYDIIGGIGRRSSRSSGSPRTGPTGACRGC